MTGVVHVIERSPTLPLASTLVSVRVQSAWYVAPPVVIVSVT